MKRLVNGVLVAVVAGPLLAACGNAPPVGPRDPQLATANQCYGVPDRAQCRLKHDLAGGYPITLAGGNR
ncbi:MAG: hypothetical protein AAF495_15725 [Pseudomonadota bacterium]